MSKVVLVGDTRLRFMGSAPKARAYVWFAPSRDYFERNPVGTVDVNKRALVTIKLRVKGRCKTTLRTRKTRIHSSGRIVRTCQKRARSDVPFALNSLFAYTAEPPRQIYEVIRPRGMLLKMMLRCAIDITLCERVIVC